jgi:hypothetical protein
LAAEESKDRDVLFAVLYLQDTYPAKHNTFKDSFSHNVFGVSDANFDVDLDPHFSEARSLFYDVLGNQKEGEGKVKFLKRPEELLKQYEYNADSDDSDAEQELLTDLGQEMGLLTTAVVETPEQEPVKAGEMSNA